MSIRRSIFGLIGYKIIPKRLSASGLVSEEELQIFHREALRKLLLAQHIFGKGGFPEWGIVASDYQKI